MAIVTTVVAVAGCTDDGGGDDEPVLDRIDGPAVVDEEQFEQQTPGDGSVRGG